MASDFGMKENGGHDAGSLRAPLLQVTRIVTQGVAKQEAFPAAPEMSSEMTLKEALSFVQIRGLRIKQKKLYAVIQRKDRGQLDEVKVKLSGKKLCISVFDSDNSRNHLIWLQ